MKVNNLQILEPFIEDWGKIIEMKHSFDPSEGNVKKKEKIEMLIKIYGKEMV